MELRESVEQLLELVLGEMSYHPFIGPFLKTSRDNPPQPYVHQYEAVGKLALRKPIRVLIGDEIGLGKTITALSISKWMERLARANKTLIVVPRVLVGQWRKELLRMGVASSRIRQVERNTIEFLKLQNFPEGYYIASMDLLKKEERIGQIVEIPWDLIIIDEVHKFGFKTARFWKIGKMLVEGSPRRNVVFLSATPHRGDPRDYIARLQLLDPYLVEGWQALDRRQFYETTHGAILFRRTKEDVNKIYEGREVFPPAKFYAGVINAREDEAEFVRRLVEFLHSKLVEFAYEKGLISERIIPLMTVLIFKRAASSPFAAMTTLERLLMKRADPEFTKQLIDSVKSFLDIGYEDYEYAEKDPDEVFNEFLDKTASLLNERDKEEIRQLRDMAKSIMEKGDSKLNALVSLLNDIMSNVESKVIVFTEYKDTLEYLIANIKKMHPEWASSLLKLSSDETRDEAVFERIKESFEKKPTARILMATDVVAEGVNLQVAHILVNYEIPWSLIKVEQRIGRVWRLGQKKPVEAYTLFMNNIADCSALNSMYEKLINLKRAELSPRPVTGQEVLLYAEAEDIIKFPPSIAVVKSGERKRFVKVTEAKAILTFIREKQAGLEKLVASIIAARQEVEKELASKGVLYKPQTKQEVENAMNLLGFRNTIEVFDAFRSLVRSSSDILGFKVVEEQGNLKIRMNLEMPKTLATIDDFYGLLTKGKRIGEECALPPVYLVAYGDTEGLMFLLPAEIRERATGTLLYRELIGMYKGTGRILRGSMLLQTVSSAISNCLGPSEGWENDPEVSFISMAEVVESLRKPASSLYEPLTRYMANLESLKLRNPEKTWARVRDLEVVPLNPVAYIRFVHKPAGLTGAVSREIKDKIEQIAVEIVMKKEREEKRTPKTVPESEHYDIRSTDPATSEIRIIEVKGHNGTEIYGELTESEAELARKESDRYWLYIVYDIESGEAKLLRCKDPLRNMNWKTFSRFERRYYLWPKESSESEDTG
jgi:superfamily II DNA or RNA helicase